MCEITPRLSPPQRAELDDLAVQVPESSLSHSQATAGIKRDVEQIKLDIAAMASGTEDLRKNERDKEELQATILRLESAVTQLRDEKEQLLEQQRSSSATAQIARSTLSLPSLVSSIRSCTPKVGASSDDRDESYHLVERPRAGTRDLKKM